MYRQVESACLIVVTLCAGFLLFEGALFFREGRKKIDVVATSTQTTLAGINTAVGQISTAANSENSYFTKEEPAVTKSLADFKHFVGALDVSFNGGLIRGDVQPGLIPKLETTVDHATETVTNLGDAAKKFGDLAPKAGDAIERFSNDSHDTLISGQQTLLAATADMTDPAIEETFNRIAASAINLDGMSSDGKKMTTDAAAFVHRELAPVRGVKNTLKAGLDWAYKIRQVALP